MSDFNENYKNHISRKIKCISKHFEASTNETYRSLNLTSQQVHIIFYLSHHQDEKVNQKNLQCEFDLSGATISGLVSRLEAKNYIKRIQDSTDKRDNFIVLTEEGRKIKEEVVEKLCENEKKLVCGFSKEELFVLTDLLDRLRTNAKELK